MYIASSLELEEKDNELNKFIDSFDDDIEQLNKKIQILENQNTALKSENDGLKSKLTLLIQYHFLSTEKRLTCFLER